MYPEKKVLIMQRDKISPFIQDDQKYVLKEERNFNNIVEIRGHGSYQFSKNDKPKYQ